jgi:hypothetical protein
MTITEAFEQVMATTRFKEDAKIKDTKGGHYRMLRTRYNRGTLKNSAMVDIILEYGYTITVKKSKEALSLLFYE